MLPVVFVIDKLTQVLIKSYLVNNSLIEYTKGLLSGISCASVRGAMRVQNVFTVAKLMALFIVIVLGLAELFAGFGLSYW